MMMMIETEELREVTGSHIRCKVLISRKLCKTETSLQQTSNRKYCMIAYRIVALFYFDDLG